MRKANKYWCLTDVVLYMRHTGLQGNKQLYNHAPVVSMPIVFIVFIVFSCIIRQQTIVQPRTGSLNAYSLGSNDAPSITSSSSQRQQK